MDEAYTGNYLPHGQELIHTSNIARLIALADLLRRTEQAPSTIGILTGTSGTGKTTAAYWYQSDVAGYPPSPQSEEEE